MTQSVGSQRHRRYKEKITGIPSTVAKKEEKDNRFILDLKYGKDGRRRLSYGGIRYSALLPRETLIEEFTIIDIGRHKEYPDKVEMMFVYNGLSTRYIMPKIFVDKLKRIERDIKRSNKIKDCSFVNIADQTLEETEKTVILKVLKKHKYRRMKTAVVLGISIRTLRNKINEYRKEGIKIKGYRISDVSKV